MSTYFLDTSSLVKRYHREVGTELVDQLFEEPERKLIISDISIIEFYSAIGLKVRTGEIEGKAFSDLRKLFSNDITQGVYQIVQFEEGEKEEAAKLLIQYAPRHSLKTLDAIQLAVMKSEGKGHVSAVICADERFGQIIELEGFRVVNPTGDRSGRELE
jgi:predicted nucleic acid-binding protein